MEAQDQSGQEQENLAGDVMESMGEPKESAMNEPDDGESHVSPETLMVQKRLKQQKRAHDREIRALQDRIAAMQNQSGADHYRNQTDDHQPPPQGDELAGHIHRAVNLALQQKDEQERKVKDAERMAHVQKQYQELQKHLDNMADKYDDFDEVVRSDDAPFTAHMRDAALLLPDRGPGSAGEVLYKLGKNRSELDRIAKLHPLDQARELNRLSHALANSGDQKSTDTVRPMGNIKSNPVRNSHAITEKTSPSEIRARMRSGNFK